MSGTPIVTTKVTFENDQMVLYYTVAVPAGCAEGVYTGQDNKQCVMCFASYSNMNANISTPVPVTTTAA
jgi:hypothetical protein